MTTSVFLNSLISIVADLSRDLQPATRYRNLLNAMQRIFPCDAAAILQLEGRVLKPMAIAGLSHDAMGRRFVVEEHPRLARILSSREPVRFAADSELPDPYDGLLDSENPHLDVHDCLGIALYIDEKPWGALTLDALHAGTFNEIDPGELHTFISLTEATVKAAGRIEELQARVVREHEVALALLDEKSQFEIIGKSSVIQHLKDEINVVAQSPLTVLIVGETGVGKELVTAQIHVNSPRADHPLVHVNCAALSENIVESELFGHVKGAFSGAVSHRAGKFELADGGTLFLDEIGELPLSIQAKMLRALQSGEIQRVGSDNNIQTDVRIIAATNRDLQQEVVKGRFRADLYHRIAVYPVHVPPLRERDKDVLLLAGYFLEKNQRRLGVPGLRLSSRAKQVLMDYSWPGNVRELEHLLSRAALKAIARQGQNSRTVILDAEHLDLSDEPVARPLIAESGDIAAISGQYLDFKESVDAYQRQLISSQLAVNNDNMAATARDLGMDSSNFYRLLKRLEIR